jgi:hypothetical protein
MSLNPHSRPDWSAIDTVLLDLDGTLLDQAYDNHIWRDLLPQRYALSQSMDLHAAYAEIARRSTSARYTARFVRTLPGCRARANFSCVCGRMANGCCCSPTRIRLRSP